MSARELLIAKQYGISKKDGLWHLYDKESESDRTFTFWHEVEDYIRNGNLLPLNIEEHNNP